MRKNAGSIWVVLIVFGSCFLPACTRKEALPQAVYMPDLASKVNTWLDLQKTNVRSTKAADGKKSNIDLVKANLRLDAASREHMNDRLDVLLIPINDAVITARHLDGHSTLSLLLFINSAGTILSGSLVYFEPSSQKKYNCLPPNTFTNLLNRKGAVPDGKYKMLDVTGKWLSQFEARNGGLNSAGVVQQKKKEQQGQRATACYEWYLVTTIFYTDGTTETTEQYLGMSCDGCSSTDFASLCSEDGGGGGSSGGDSANEIIEGDADIEGASTSAPDPSTGLDLGSAQLINPSFSGHVQYVFDRTLVVVVNVTAAKPNVLPVSQPFTDSDGHPALLTYTIGPWNFSWYPLTPGVFFAQYTFDLVRTYIYVTGTRAFTFTEGLSKVISCL